MSAGSRVAGGALIVVGAAFVVYMNMSKRGTKNPNYDGTPTHAQCKKFIDAKLNDPKYQNLMYQNDWFGPWFYSGTDMPVCCEGTIVPSVLGQYRGVTGCYSLDTYDLVDTPRYGVPGCCAGIVSLPTTPKLK